MRKRGGCRPDQARQQLGGGQQHPVGVDFAGEGGQHGHAVVVQVAVIVLVLQAASGLAARAAAGHANRMRRAVEVHRQVGLGALGGPSSFRVERDNERAWI